jgi:hypothetical protein
MRIPVNGEGQVILWMIANTALIGPVTVDVTPVTIHDPSTNLMIFPNPADDLLIIQGLNETGILKIYNVSGTLMKTVNLDADHAEINVSGLKEGMYLLHIETENGMFTRKLSLQ